MNYTFDLTTYGALDLATLQVLMQQQAWGALFMHVARFAQFDVAAVPIGEMEAMYLAFGAALRAHVARQQPNPAAEATARRLLGQALGEVGDG